MRKKDYFFANPFNQSTKQYGPQTLGPQCMLLNVTLVCFKTWKDLLSETPFLEQLRKIFCCYL